MNDELVHRGGVEMVTAARLASELQVTVETLRRWRRIKRGGPPSYRIGGQLRYRRDEVDAWVRSRADGDNA